MAGKFKFSLMLFYSTRPCTDLWTALGDCVRHGLVDLVFEVHRGFATEGAVEPLAVVKNFDPLKDGGEGGHLDKQSGGGGAKLKNRGAGADWLPRRLVALEVNDSQEQTRGVQALVNITGCRNYL